MSAKKEMNQKCIIAREKFLKDLKSGKVTWESIRQKKIVKLNKQKEKHLEAIKKIEEEIVKIDNIINKKAKSDLIAGYTKEQIAAALKLLSDKN